MKQVIMLTAIGGLMLVMVTSIGIIVKVLMSLL